MKTVPASASAHEAPKTSLLKSPDCAYPGRKQGS